MVGLGLTYPWSLPPGTNSGVPFPCGGHVWPLVVMCCSIWTREGHLQWGPGIGRKAPQSKWNCMDRPNVLNLLVQMDDGLSNGPPMSRQFGPSKGTVVQWTAYVMSIWTVQMDDGPMDLLCYVNLDLPNEQWSIGPSSIWTVHWTAYTTLIWSIKKIWLLTLILDRKKW